MWTTVLIALTCVLSARADVTPMQDFSLEKMAGKWYMVGYATNADWFVKHKDTMKTGNAVLVPTEEGELDMSFAALKADGTCWRMTQHANKTDTPGRYTFYSQIWHNHNDMHIVDAVYDNYALIHTIKTNDVNHVLINLYSRGPEVSADLQQKFTVYSEAAGILPENIAILPKNEECPEVATTAAP